MRLHGETPYGAFIIHFRLKDPIYASYAMLYFGSGQQKYDRGVWRREESIIFSEAFESETALQFFTALVK
eukprot:NODE_3919_length_371_cov_1.391304_g3343_i0.p1 GENE.NODE_3919_length_371_cov_1.391304_g3343_i0~~NODE_3919_length_371_cov_1.391304_g3343_i0.p1  ORF type:complete len:70 (+),score=2.44 NODE_3919_length_371_cov_1.391304_g3343_i0:92-301(+)